MLCFNSPLGILVVRTSGDYEQMAAALRSFNSPLGILVVRTEFMMLNRMGEDEVSIPRSEFWLFGPPHRARLAVAGDLFQFPARNSGCSDATESIPTNSTVGVSIPRSEFWLFGQYDAKPSIS